MSESNKKALKWLATALKMEERGETFYESAKNQCVNKQGRDILQMLQADEIVHKYRVTMLYESIASGKGWDVKLLAEKADLKKLNAFFDRLSKKQSKEIAADISDLKAMDIGIDFELKAINFYERHLSEAANPTEQAFLKLMINEERSHYDALSDMKLFLIDPTSWLRIKEKSGLDGMT